MKTTINTWLPVFPGFYNTYFDSTDDESQDAENTRENYDGIPDDWRPEYNYFDWKAAVCKAACQWIENTFTHPCEGGRYEGFDEIENAGVYGIETVKYEKLVSPREYNFETDSIDCEITLDTELFSRAFTKFVKQHAEQWEKYLADYYKSRDGFMSFYTHDPVDWFIITNKYRFDNARDSKGNDRYFDRRHTIANGTHALGRCIDFLFHAADPKDRRQMDLYTFVSERVYISEYLTNLPETATRK